MRWNVDGALQRPKGITINSKAPNCVLKAVFLISLSWILIWWNPLTRSIFENTVEPPQRTQDGLDRWQRIPISSSSRIQRPVVDAHAPFTIPFLHQQASRSVWTRGWSDPTRWMQLVQLSSKFI